MNDDDMMCVLQDTLGNWDSRHAETMVAQIAVLSALLAKDGFPASYRDDVTMLVRRAREALQPMEEKGLLIRTVSSGVRALQDLTGTPQRRIIQRRIVRPLTVLEILLTLAMEQNCLPSVGAFYLDVAEPLLWELPEAPEAMRILHDLRQAFQDLAVAQKSVAILDADLSPVLASLQEKLQQQLIRTAW